MAHENKIPQPLSRPDGADGEACAVAEETNARAESRSMPPSPLPLTTAVQTSEAPQFLGPISGRSPAVAAPTLSGRADLAPATAEQQNSNTIAATAIFTEMTELLSAVPQVKFPAAPPQQSMEQAPSLPRPPPVAAPEIPAARKKRPRRKKPIPMGQALRSEGMDERAIACAYAGAVEILRKGDKHGQVEKLLLEFLKECTRHLEPTWDYARAAGFDEPAIIRLVHNVPRPVRSLGPGEKKDE